MVMERLEAARKHPENQTLKKQKGIEMMGQIFKDYDIVEPGSRFEQASLIIPQEAAPVTTETPRIVEPLTLEAHQVEIERQALRYSELEFHKHKKLRMSKGKFKDAIMSLVISQPESFVGRFDIPSIAFGQIPSKDQCELAGVDSYLDGLEVSDWQEDPGGFRTPDKIYMNWMYDGGKNLKTAVSTVRANLLKDTRGATYYDGIGLYVARPEILKDHYIDLPGTSVGSDAPDLSLLRGRPGLHCHWVGNAFDRFGSALCGRI